MDLVQLTNLLVGAPSYAEVGEELAATITRDAMIQLGYQNVGIDELGNVTGVVPGTGPGCVVFDGHLDTVGVGNKDDWTSDPFVAPERNGRLYGRGTADMKGAIAAMIVGVARLLDEPPACDIVVSASIAEELVEGYALGRVLERYPAKAVVIGEATNLNLARAQRGRVEILIETIGTPAHSSTPQLGINAVKSMARAVTALSELELPVDPLLGPAVLEVTDILSQPYPGLSVVPERCLATFDRRMLVGESVDEILGRVRAELDRLEIPSEVSVAVDRFNSWTGIDVSAPNDAPAWRMDDDALIVRTALAALTIAGLTPDLTHYAFCTNGSESGGRRGIPTIGFGPGEESEAHTIDESVEIEQLNDAAVGYEALARELAHIN